MKRIYLVTGYDDGAKRTAILQVLSDRTEAITYAWDLDLDKENLTSIAVYSYEPIINGSSIRIYRREQ